MGALESILTDDVQECSTPIGAMTTENRDTWAEVRDHMISHSARNQKSLKEVDSAIFVLSLDEEQIGEDPVSVTRQYLHSNGINRQVVNLIASICRDIDFPGFLLYFFVCLDGLISRSI